MLFFVAATPMPSVKAQVIDGYLGYVSFWDFTTMIYHPYNLESYLPAGEQGQVPVSFYSNFGTGQVTVKAYSDAFTSDSTTTKDVPEIYTTIMFDLTFEIKADIDGSFEVIFEARNEFNTYIDRSSATITVWSPEHIQAADELFSLETQLVGLISVSPHGMKNITLANSEYAAATLAYNNRDWDRVSSLCSSAELYFDSATNAEIAWAQKDGKNKQEATQLSKNLSSLLNTLVGPMTILFYLTIIIVILGIIFLVVAVWRKIKPLHQVEPS
jgi:hypothetical protein